jgi:rod shape determining protein RodA
MYSSGYDHGTRFVDHGRNMLIAGTILFVVAQVPPQRIMAFAVPCTAGVALLVAVALFGITKKGAQRWVNRGHRHPAQRDSEDCHAADAGLVVPKARGQLRPLDFVVRGPAGLPVGLIMKQPDLGTSLLVLAAGLSVIFFAGLSWKLVLPPVLLGGRHCPAWWFEPELCADGVRWPVLHDYQQQRICTCWTPRATRWAKAFTSSRA